MAFFHSNLSNLVDDLVIVAESLDELTERLKLWKENMESKRLRVNMPKTKCLVSDGSIKSIRETGKYPCSICHWGIGRNSVFCVYDLLYRQIRSKEPYVQEMVFTMCL